LADAPPQLTAAAPLPRRERVVPSDGEGAMGGNGQHVDDEVNLGNPRRPVARDHQEGIPQGERTDASPSIGPDGCPGGWGSAVVEMTLLLTSRQLDALERAAYHLGLTTGHFIRRRVREFIESEDARTFGKPVTSDASAD
jgi:hypothetical protein